MGGDATPGRWDQRPLVASLLRQVGERFGDVVAVVIVDHRSATATPLLAIGPDRHGDDELQRLVGTSVPLNGTICGRIVETGQALTATPATDPPGGVEAIPEGWLHHAERHGLASLLVLPIRRAGAVDGLLVAARADPSFGADEIRSLTESADRLGPLLPPGPAPAPGAEPAPPGPTRLAGAVGGGGRRAALDVAVGLVPVAVIAAAYATVDQPDRFRPGALLLVAVTGVALLRGRQAALVAGAASAGVLWWELVPRYRSLAFASSADAAGLALFSGAIGAVLVLVDRVGRSQEAAQRQAELVAALVRETPVGIGLLDDQLRFQEVNDRLAELDGVPADQHRGRRPGDLGTPAGADHERALRVVRDRLEARHGDVVSQAEPGGPERHWRVDYFPVRSSPSDGVELGIAATDVTDEVVTRRRAQLLLRLARSVGGATGRDEVAEAVVDVLAEGVPARAVVALAEGDAVRIRAAAGYPDPAAFAAWDDVVVRPGTRCLLATSLAAVELVAGTVAGGPGHDADPEAEVRRRLGDRTVVWQPIVVPGQQAPVGAVGLSWSFDRPLTEHSRTLLATTASVAGLALARIELTERDARDRLAAAMEAMIDLVVVAHAVRDDHGDIVDFEIDYANAAAQRSPHLVGGVTAGARVGERFAHWRESGLFDRFRQVVETGEPLVADRVPYRSPTGEGDAGDDREPSWWNLQVVRVGDGYIASIRDVTDVVRAEEAAREARRTAERERVAIELLQRAALPTELPAMAGIELSAHYRPARNDQPVGGDWYDAFALGDDALALVVADVAGHGHAAAAFMVQVRNLFLAVAADHREPATVLGHVDRLLHRINTHGLQFVTCCYAVLEPGSGQLSWASAGHPPPVVSSAAGRAELAEVPPGPPLGALPGARYQAAQRTLAAGDAVVLYTDGLVERRGELIDDGVDRLRAMVGRRLADGGDGALARQLAALAEDPDDDIAVLCARLVAPSPA